MACSATVGVIGLGYVGLPLQWRLHARASQQSDSMSTSQKIHQLNRGRSYIGAVNSEYLSELVGRSRFRATSEFIELESCDVIIICVPTPLTRHAYWLPTKKCLATATRFHRARGARMGSATECSKTAPKRKKAVKMRNLLRLLRQSRGALVCRRPLLPPKPPSLIFAPMRPQVRTILCGRSIHLGSKFGQARVGGTSASGAGGCIQVRHAA